LRGARLNVAINLASITDQAYVTTTTQRAEQLEGDAESGRQAAIRWLSPANG